MAKSLALVLLPLLVSSFTVFGEELETLPPTSPHTPAPLHPPTKSPAHPPAHHHHHHHHLHSPAPAPVEPPVTIHPPSPSPHHHYPPTPAPAPAKPPTHHHPHPHPHPPTPTPPAKPPTKPPTPHIPPAKAPTHPHYPPAPTHPHPPAKPPTPHIPPAKPPTHPPAKPPTPHIPPTPAHPPVPVHPPFHPPLPRSFVAVQGVVYVKSCKYAAFDSLSGATPLLGAVVKLQCNNTKYKLVQNAETDKNGYFFIKAPKTITNYGAHKCNVVLVSAPTGLKPSNLHGGVTGAVLRPEKPFVYQGLPFLLYTAGPLAFDPKCPR